jgi:hypothetical protein
MYCILALAVLFVVLSPGVFVRLPEKGSRVLVMAVHTTIFVVLGYLLCNMINNVEGFQEGCKAKKNGSQVVDIRDGHQCKKGDTYIGVGNTKLTKNNDGKWKNGESCPNMDRILNVKC